MSGSKSGRRKTVRNGCLVESLARPGGNATGLSGMTQELYPKRLELIRQTFPGVKRVALLTNLENPAAATAAKAGEIAATSINLDLRVFDVHRADEIDTAVAEMAKLQVGAVIIASNATLISRMPHLLELTTKYRLPTMLTSVPIASPSTLIAFGGDIREYFRRATVYVDKILKGACPENLPVESRPRSASSSICKRREPSASPSRPLCCSRQTRSSSRIRPSLDTGPGAARAAFAQMDSGKLCERCSPVARGCKTSIAYPTFRGSPSQPGRAVSAST